MYAIVKPLAAIDSPGDFNLHTHRLFQMLQRFFAAEQFTDQ